MMRPLSTAHVDLDVAWPPQILDPHLDLRDWGPRLRYSATPALLDSFFETVQPTLPAFTLYGSGDFHHLSALWLRNLSAPVSLVSFDNHPDWDIRPPYWGCGGWINRALSFPNVQRASVWGCGNFELRFPSRLFANRTALKNGRLEVHAWAERQSAAVARRFDCMTRENWRDRFARFAASLKDGSVYITVDMDCLSSETAVTNWENGLFTADDVAWAIGEVRSNANMVGADVCGARSVPKYARWRQRFAGNWDHPKAPQVDAATALRTNLTALRIIRREMRV